MPGSSRATNARIGSGLLLALWFGVVAGVGEATLLAARKLVAGQFIQASADALWMVPLIHTLFFLIVGATLWAASRLAPGIVTDARRVCVLVTLAAFAWLLNYGRLHWGAALVLALGVGAVAARGWDRHATAALRWIRLTAAPLASLIPICILSITAWRAWRGPKDFLGPEGTRRPNILLLVLDTVRALDLSVYGYHRPTTPNLERLAARGTRFAHAIAPAPWTLPTHASMFTGRWPHELNADWRAPLNGQYPTVAEQLVESGYATAGFVANTGYCSRESGLARGFGHYEDYPISLSQAIWTTALGKLVFPDRWTERSLLRVTADDINRRMLQWLDGRDATQPFFAFLNYMDAHEPYQPPEPFKGRFSSPDSDRHLEPHRRSIPPNQWPPETVRAAQDAYDEAIAYLDSRVGQLIDQLEQRGLLDNTVVIVTADHGEEFGEHGVFNHGYSLYRRSLEVPLLIGWPGHAPAGTVVNTPVSLRELAATIIEIAGRDPSLPGRSLSRHWRDSSQAAIPDSIISAVRHDPGLPDDTPVAQGSMTSILLNGFRLVVRGKGGQQLYDFNRDPDERVDLSTSSEMAPILDSLWAALASLGAVSETAAHAP